MAKFTVSKGNMSVQYSGLVVSKPYKEAIAFLNSNENKPKTIGFVPNKDVDDDDEID